MDEQDALAANRNEEDWVHMANELLIRFGREPYIKNLGECDHKYFVEIYEAMLGESLPGLTSAENVEDQIHNIQVVVDSLSADVLGIDLSHVDAQRVVNKDLQHISNLIEIFDGLLDFVLEELVNDDIKQKQQSHAGNDSVDSNQFADDHDILSDVFLEEFGRSYLDEISSRNQHVEAGERPLSPFKTDGKPFRNQKIIPNLEIGDSVTWRSGNNSHTVAWSKGVCSPSGDSTCTEELINLAQSTGNSTDELIKEAQSIQKDLNSTRLEAYRSQKVVIDPKEGKKEEKVVVSSPSTEQWASILSQTSSAVESLAEMKEIGQRPRRKLPFEKRDKKKTMKQDNVQQVHKHTHHHFHHLHTDSPPLSDIGSTCSGSSTTFTKVPEITIDSPDHYVQHNQGDQSATTFIDSTTSTNNTIDKFIEAGPHKKYKKSAPLDKERGQQQHMVENTMETQTSTSLHSAVQKENNITSRLMEHHQPERDFSIGSNKVQSNIQVPVFVPDTRSKQLSELGERLQKLREQVKPKVAALSSTSTNMNMSEDLKIERPNLMGEDKKEKAKVSFAIDSQLDEHLHSLSDTEIDYCSPTIHMKVFPRDRQPRHVQQSPPKKSILRKKISHSDSSATSGDEMNPAADNLSITAQFEHPYLKRDERLRHLQKGLKAEEKENKYGVQKLRDKYSKQHVKMIKQKKMIKKQSNLQVREKKKKENIIERFETSPQHIRRSPTNKYAVKLTNIYGKLPPEKSTDKIKRRKRSASASPVGRRKKYKTPLVVHEDEILPIMEDEFPFLHLSPHTAKLMWQKQLRQINNLRKHAMPHKTSKIQRTVEDARKKQKALADIMKKELEHNKRMKEIHELKDKETVVRRNLQERRQRSARARRYYNEYAIRNKARMLRKRTKEEKIFKQLFEDGLDIQKQRIKEMRDYAREQKEKNTKKQQDEIESLENFYRDKFSSLAESVAQEKYDVEVRQKAQAQVLGKMRTQMRNRMEKDLKEIQQQLANDDDAYYFRQLDADVLKKEFQLATYKASRFK